VNAIPGWFGLWIGVKLGMLTGLCVGAKLGITGFGGGGNIVSGPIGTN